ncbi:MAG: helix-turn-helix domain-containing protein [Paenibacillaceae bacterium]|nr:helix-turn-helix domain-containing protein [Paenibacillaceae bacterium]
MLHVMFKRHSIAIPWLLSYAAILLVPLLVSIVTYTQTNRTVAEEINRSNNLILSKVRQDMDSWLADIDRLSIEIAFNPQVQELLTIQGPLMPEQYFTLYKAFESLKVYQSSQRSAHYFVYFPSIDAIVTPEISNSSEVVYNHLYTRNPIPYEEWKTRLQQRYNGDYVQLGNSAANENGGIGDLAYVRSVPIGNPGSTNRGNVVILLDDSKFWIAGGVDYIHNGVAAILDKQDRVLASTSPLVEPMPVGYKELAGKSGVLKASYSGQPVVVSYISSEATEWKYMILMPERVYWDKSEYIKKATAIGLLVCLLLGGGLAYLFVRKNYSLVRALMELFHGRKNVDIASGAQNNEFNFLRQAIHSTITENEDMSSRLTTFMRGRFIEKLLKGKESAIPLEQSLDAYGMHFVSDAFTVMIVRANEDADMPLPEFRSAVAIAIDQAAGPTVTGYLTEMDDWLVYLLNCDKREESDDRMRDASASAIAHRIAGHMETQHAISPSITVSGVHNSAFGIAKAYDEALEAMEYQSIYGVTGVLRYSDMNNGGTRGEYYYPLEKEQSLMNSIKAGEYGYAEAIIDDIFKDHLEQRKLPLKLAKCLFVDLVSTMLKTINDMSSISDNPFLEPLDPIERLLECRTVNEMKGQLKQILSDICGYVRQEQAGKRHASVVQTMASIVQEQYRSIDLSIVSIADQMGLHPASVSRIFKEGTGSPLLEYIAKVRIAEAKKIMQEPGMTMDIVAQAVGYSNVRTFRRIFAKHEGVTPGKYMDLL